MNIVKSLRSLQTPDEDQNYYHLKAKITDLSKDLRFLTFMKINCLEQQSMGRMFPDSPRKRKPGIESVERMGGIHLSLEDYIEFTFVLS
jgi:hypothetical protein